MVSSVLLLVRGATSTGLINSNPVEVRSILRTPEEILALITKDGKIYKNTV